MKQPTVILATLIIAELALAGCHGVPPTARVKGDVYLVMQNGDVKRGAGNEVRLVRNPDSLRPAIDRICSQYADHLLLVWRKTDSAVALERQTREAMRSLLLGATVGRASTGINAHYHLDSVPPGKYALWAETDIGDRHYTWFVPVTVAPSDSLTKDLDNSAEADAHVYCGRVPAEVIAKGLQIEADSTRIAHLREDSLNRSVQQRKDSLKRIARHRADSLTRIEDSLTRIADSLRASAYRHLITGVWEGKAAHASLHLELTENVDTHVVDGYGYVWTPDSLQQQQWTVAGSRDGRAVKLQLTTTYSTYTLAPGDSKIEGSMIEDDRIDGVLTGKLGGAFVLRRLSR
jgi:hypothetical protein